MATATPAPAAGALTPRGFRLALAGAAVAGLATRVAYGLATKDPEGFTAEVSLVTLAGVAVAARRRAATALATQRGAPA